VGEPTFKRSKNIITRRKHSVALHCFINLLNPFNAKVGYLLSKKTGRPEANATSMARETRSPPSANDANIGNHVDIAFSKDARSNLVSTPDFRWVPFPLVSLIGSRLLNFSKEPTNSRVADANIHALAKQPPPIPRLEKGCPDPIRSISSRDSPLGSVSRSGVVVEGDANDNVDVRT
jgi:hypothetical protein